ncbi:hypothetical protein FR698_00355 [Pelomicrobium methylotrophicum]|uniref:Uncharacterized protein n=1 Tax=Pelomicrobium methylotrophicum TaxID=2602750 RepID=A0A5C7F1E9_9PROT|nr:hypothetical protein FR698_00355 [Pelomicrobium methylotrophicum]
MCGRTGSKSEPLGARATKGLAQSSIIPCPAGPQADGQGWQPISGRAGVRLIELDPKYVDVIVRRWQDGRATREADGVAFDQAASSVCVHHLWHSG